MTKSFRPWRVDEVWLLPPSVQDFVPTGHPAHLVRDIVREDLDLGAILSAYTEARRRVVPDALWGDCFQAPQSRGIPGQQGL